MFRSQAIIIYLAVLVLFILPLNLGAQTNRLPRFVLAEGEIFGGNLFKAADVIEINGRVDQDLILIGNRVVINGEVGGDVLVLAGILKINGSVNGSVRSAASTIEINGTVKRNVQTAALDLRIGDKASVGWQMNFIAGHTEISGEIKGRVDGFGDQVILNGQVDGKAKISLSPKGSLLIGSGARIKDDLVYHAQKEAQVDDGADISSIKKLPLSSAVLKADTKFNQGLLLWQLINLFGIFVVGMVLITLFRRPVLAVLGFALNHPLRSLGWGIGTLVVTPVVLVILAFSIIGVPLSLIGAGLYLLLLYVGQLIAGIALGMKIIWWFDKERKLQIKSLLLPMILGISLLFVLFSLPYFGYLIKALAVLIGLGAMVIVLRQLVMEAK